MGSEMCIRDRGHLVATDSGIDEVDRISSVLVRSAQQLSQSISSERSFASDASHQLRTPLTALLMRLEEIAATDDIEVAREEAAVAISQVERLSRVVDELLQRRRSVPETARPEVVLDSVLASLQREWQPAFETARRSIRVHGERGLSVRATPIALSQVFSTLLENSLVHGRGTVEIQVRRSGPSVVVEVCDEGDGVSATMAPHIFERSVSSGAGWAWPWLVTWPNPSAGGWSSSLGHRRPSRFSFPRPAADSRLESKADRGPRVVRDVQRRPYRRWWRQPRARRRRRNGGRPRTGTASPGRCRTHC
mgnify:CR=1 FL=1